MKKTTWIFAGILMFSTIISTGAGAIKRQHRPWLMVGGEESSEPTRRANRRVTRSTFQPKSARKPTPSAAAPKPKPEPVSAIEPEPPATPAGKEIVSKAMEYRGTRYRFGGNTKKGLDCSGLVTRIFADLNLKKLPRASSSLYKVGTPVNLADLRPGDLVFFKNTYRRGISHVGIYAGSNKFVHANERFGVTVTKLSDPYYQLHYAGARRIY